jgi:hypothetical protein
LWYELDKGVSRPQAGLEVVTKQVCLESWPSWHDIASNVTGMTAAERQRQYQQQQLSTIKHVSSSMQS